MHQLGVEMSAMVIDHYGSVKTNWDIQFTHQWNELQQGV